MSSSAVRIGPVSIGGGEFVVVAGPCVIESESVVRQAAHYLAGICGELGVGFILKSSYVKANRTSAASFRGPGLKEGLAILERIKREVGCPVLVDVHETAEVDDASKVADILQIPAFLCRQTALLESAGASGLPVNIKKGQFMAPEDMRFAAQKVERHGGGGVILTERGTSFGYHDLVVDMRSLVRMREFGYPVVFDATHSTQSPGAMQGQSGGERCMAAPLARAAVAVGVDGLFMEVHPAPHDALSDAAVQLDFSSARALLEDVVRVRAAVDRLDR